MRDFKDPEHRSETQRIRIATSLSVGFVLLLSFVASVSAQDKPKYKELPNFHEVNPKVYRGAQPQQGGINRLVQLGIKTIINLRDDDERARAEETEAQKAGLRYFNLPLANFGKPDQTTVQRLLNLISAPENQPVFVHCKRGADRTGTIIAIYRIEFDGWTSEQAKDEAKRFGLGFWQVQMKDYIHDYYERRKQRTEPAVQRKESEPVTSSSH